MDSQEEGQSAPEGRRLRDERRDGKIRRIASDMQGLVQDLQKWIDLRLDLAVLEVEERIDKLRNDLALGVTVAILAFFAALFTLTTLALGVGWFLGRPFWGFLAVAVLLILILGVLQTVKPQLMPPSNLFETLRERQEDEEPNGPEVPPEETRSSTENGSTATESPSAS